LVLELDRRMGQAYALIINLEGGSMRGTFVLLAAAAASVVVVAVAAPVARADYGNTAQYQAAISLNCDNKRSFFCTNVVGLGGLWEWFAFSNDHTFDATETFCGHNDPVFGSGAFHVNVDGIWKPDTATGESPFGAPVDFFVSTDGGQTWEDTLIPYVQNTSAHYTFKGGPGISGEAQVAYIPSR
jgi:hypothetical protein